MCFSIWPGFVIKIPVNSGPSVSSAHQQFVEGMLLLNYCIDVSSDLLERVLICSWGPFLKTNKSLTQLEYIGKSLLILE